MVMVIQATRKVTTPTVRTGFSVLQPISERGSGCSGIAPRTSPPLLCSSPLVHKKWRVNHSSQGFLVATASILHLTSCGFTCPLFPMKRGSPRSTRSGWPSPISPYWKMSSNLIRIRSRLWRSVCAERSSQNAESNGIQVVSYCVRI